MEVMRNEIIQASILHFEAHIEKHRITQAHLEAQVSIWTNSHIGIAERNIHHEKILKPTRHVNFWKFAYHMGHTSLSASSPFCDWEKEQERRGS